MSFQEKKKETEQEKNFPQPNLGSFMVPITYSLIARKLDTVHKSSPNHHSNYRNFLGQEHPLPKGPQGVLAPCKEEQ